MLQINKGSVNLFLNTYLNYLFVFYHFFETVGMFYGVGIHYCSLSPHINKRSINLFLHSVRGQSVFFNLALTERNMQIKFDLKLSVYSLGLDI